MRRSGWSRWLLLAVLTAACSDDPAATHPPVAFIDVVPADTALAPGDSVWLSATAFDVSGRMITGMPFTWHTSDPGAVRLDETGMARALAPGDARIEAREVGSVRGFADIRVRRVSGFTPGHGAFGQVVRLRGAGFTPETRVLFGEAEAFVRSVDDDGRGMEVWVPVGATTAPLWVMAGAFDVATDRPFFVTGGGDDALEPNGVDLPAGIPFPYENPSLLTRPMFTPLDPDVYRFSLLDGGPLHLEVTDRSPEVGRLRTMRVEIFDEAVEDIVALTSTFAFLRREGIEPLHVSFPHLRAGQYRIMITPFAFVSGFSNIAAGDRSYGMRLDAEPVFGLPPDPYEPNSYPRDAAPVPFPSEIEAVIEHPWGADYFTFELTSPQAVHLRLRTGGTIVDDDLDLFLMSHPTKSVPYILAVGPFPPVFAMSIGDSSVEDIVRNLPAGRYVVGVLDSGGVPAAYRLQLMPWAGGAPPAEARAADGDGAPVIDKLVPWAAARSPLPFFPDD